MRVNGVMTDTIHLKSRNLSVFQFYEKNVEKLDADFSIKNNEGLLFNLSNQTDFNFGTRGFVFVKNKDTMYLEIGSGFTHSLYRIKTFKKGYFHYMPKKISASDIEALGDSFINDEAIQNIPITYGDYRKHLPTKKLGKTEFQIIEVSEDALSDIHYFRLEEIKERMVKKHNRQ